MQSDEPASKGSAEVIDDRHDQVDRDDQGEQPVFQKEADGDLGLLAQSAGSDVAQDHLRESETENDGNLVLDLGHQGIRQGTNTLAGRIRWPQRSIGPGGDRFHALSHLVPTSCAA